MSIFEFPDDFSGSSYSIFHLDSENFSLVPFDSLRVIFMGEDDFLERVKALCKVDYAVYFNSNNRLESDVLLNSLRMRPDAIIMSEGFYSNAMGDAKLAIQTGHQVFVLTDL